MTCTHVKLPDGGTAIVCGPRQRPRKCKCGRRATLLCDFPKPRKRSGTCDKPLCPACAVSVGEDRDHCPDHGLFEPDLFQQPKETP